MPAAAISSEAPIARYFESVGNSTTWAPRAAEFEHLFEERLGKPPPSGRSAIQAPARDHGEDSQRDQGPRHQGLALVGVVHGAEPCTGRDRERQEPP